MRKGIKEALLRVTEIVIHAETGCSQEVHGHDKACEKSHFGALPSAIQSYHAFETGSTDQENARRSGAPGLLLVPCFLARTGPLSCRRMDRRWNLIGEINPLWAHLEGWTLQISHASEYIFGTVKSQHCPTCGATFIST